MKAVGEWSWLLSWDDEDERSANERARAAAVFLRDRSPRGLVDVIPAARTLFVEGSPAFDAGILAGLEAAVPETESVRCPAREHEIRVRLDGQDLPEVLSTLELGPGPFREALLAATFTVGFLGFSPGFAYLYGLPANLRLPRRRTPRLKVPARSLAMAGPYVGIYPAELPGGWNLLGTAEGTFFDISRRPPALFSPGDVVRFMG